ncbi:MAG: 4-hydroxythreonine-4-phosphate dehydrogenase PdxA [Aureliella sp.]
MEASLPRIGLTMGDPAGVGPEIVLSVLGDRAVTGHCHLIVFGDAAVLERCAAVTGQTFDCQVVPLAQWQRDSSQVTGSAVIDCGSISADQFQPGIVSAATGEASYQYIQRAIDAALAGHIAAVTTAPINKEALHAAGHLYPGHTEMFAERAGAERACMLQFSPEITCSFVTVHCGYAEVPSLLTEQRVLDVIELTAQALERLRGPNPKLVVCGLNPHAGEHGLFGDREEERIIIPAIERARGEGLDIEGPLPPDTAFLPWKRQATDAYICMYHDQGHIPVKALAFDSAVNTTLGISIIRTSVDHGTACDIAWQGKARTSSLRAALDVAIKLAK